MKYAVPSPNTYQVLLATPSYHTEGECKWSSYEKYLIYKTQMEGRDMYEARLHHYADFSDETFKISSAMWLNHPSLTKASQIAVELTGSEGEGTGAIELDIFPETENKIRGTVTTRRIANNSWQFETALESKVGLFVRKPEINFQFLVI